MARITIDDCTDKIENRFELVLLSAHRARLLLEGVTIGVSNSNSEKFEKKTVHALREISEENITPQELKDSLVGKMQTEKKIKDFIEDANENENKTHQEIFSEQLQNDKIYQATFDPNDEKLKKNISIFKDSEPKEETPFNFQDSDVVDDQE